MTATKYILGDLSDPPRRLAGRKPLICALGVKGLGDSPLRLDVTLYSALETLDCSAPIRYRFSTYAVGRRREYPSQSVEEYHAEKWAHLFPAEYRILATLQGCDAESGAPIHGAENGFYWLAGACGGFGQEYHGGNGSNKKTPLECLNIAREMLRVSEIEIRHFMAECALSTDPKKRFLEMLLPVRVKWRQDAEKAKKAFDLPYINGRVGR